MMYLLSFLDRGVIMLNRRLAYLMSSSSCSIILCAAERMHKVGKLCVYKSNYELINHLFNSHMQGNKY